MGIGPVAVHTILWRWFVEQNRLTLRIALLRMAHRAAHIRVPARQRKLSPFVVVKRRGSPALFHMAVRAFCDSILRCKLRPMGIRVAGFANFGCPLELNFVGAGQCLMAFIARYRTVSPDKSKFRSRMVEASNIDPGLGAVAGFAAKRGSVGTFLPHAIFEFAVVRVAVAGGARAVVEMKRQNLVRSSAKAGLVAIRACNSHVSPGQHEMRVLVLGNGERRAMKIFYGVAILAAIEVQSGSKLLVMRILMTISACPELYFVNSVLAGGRVAFVASDGRMFSLQRIMRRQVLLHTKLRWLPPFDGMAL